MKIFGNIHNIWVHNWNFDHFRIELIPISYIAQNKMNFLEHKERICFFKSIFKQSKSEFLSPGSF